MFTGLVESKVPLVSLRECGPGKRLIFNLGALAQGVCIGDSIALAGCCLTVVEIGVEIGGDFPPTCCHFELGSETLSKTSFGVIQVGDEVNCERSLQVGQRLGGHYVTGHVDGLGQVTQIRDEGEWRFIEFSASQSLLRQMAPKGSVTIDGVSLTLVRADDGGFSVALIPHTLSVTTLGKLREGSQVHLETDILAKYVARQLTSLAPSH